MSLTNMRSSDFTDSKVTKVSPTTNITMQDTPVSVSTSLLAKIHLKCNDNAANTVVTNNGSIAENGVASANTSLIYTASGKINGAFNFNKLYSVNGDNFLNDMSSDAQGTFAGWVYNRYTGGFDDIYNTQFFHIGSNKLLYFNQKSLNGSLDFGLYNNGYKWGLEKIVSFNQWHFFSIVQDGVAVKIKIDNILETSYWASVDKSQWIANLTGETRLRFGQGSYLDYCFHSKNDDFRYYNFALTDEQLAFIYNSGAGTEAELSNMVTSIIKKPVVVSTVDHLQTVTPVIIDNNITSVDTDQKIVPVTLDPKLGYSNTK